MFGVAMGQMGLGLDDFLNLTPFEFEAIQSAYFEKIVADREWEENLQWQVARWQVWRNMCPPDKKQLSVIDLIELPGDEEIKAQIKQRQTDAEKYKKAKSRFGDKF